MNACRLGPRQDHSWYLRMEMSGLLLMIMTIILQQRHREREGKLANMIRRELQLNR